MPKILSITAAPPGWFAIFKDEGSQPPSEYPVALWALVEDDEDPSLRWAASYSCSEGDAADLMHTDNETSNFGGYVYRAPTI